MKRMGQVVSILFSLRILVAVVGAQAPASAGKTEKIPTLTEVETLKLDKVVLEFDNINKQIQLLQLAQENKKNEVNALITSLSKPGYTLNRDERGVWTYVAVPPEVKK